MKEFEGTLNNTASDIQSRDLRALMKRSDIRPRETRLSRPLEKPARPHVDPELKNLVIDVLANVHNAREAGNVLVGLGKEATEVIQTVLEWLAVRTEAEILAERAEVARRLEERTRLERAAQMKAEQERAEAERKRVERIERDRAERLAAETPKEVKPTVETVVSRWGPDDAGAAYLG